MTPTSEAARQLDEALAARPLTSEQVTDVEARALRGSFAGARYPTGAMAQLDSEKR